MSGLEVDASFQQLATADHLEDKSRDILKKDRGRHTGKVEKGQSAYHFVDPKCNMIWKSRA